MMIAIFPLLVHLMSSMVYLIILFNINSHQSMFYLSIHLIHQAKLQILILISLQMEVGSQIHQNGRQKKGKTMNNKPYDQSMNGKRQGCEEKIHRSDSKHQSTCINQLTTKYMDKSGKKYQSLDETYIANDSQLPQEDNSDVVNESSKQVQEIRSKELQQKIKQFEREFNMNQILQFIYDVADRNEVYRCNFIHLHIPLALVLRILDIRTNTAPKEVTYLRSIIKAITTKVQTNKSMRRQINKEKTIQDFTLKIHNPHATQDQLLVFLRKFLTDNKEIMMAVMPYYYNYFALVINKEIIFLGKPGDLLQYSIQYKHENYYNGNFKRTDVMNILTIFEKKLVEKYHSKDI